MIISEKLTDLEALEDERIEAKKCPYFVLSLRMREIFFSLFFLLFYVEISLELTFKKF